MTTVPARPPYSAPFDNDLRDRTGYETWENLWQPGARAFWSARLGKRELSAFQASARGGSLRLVLDGDRVRLGGQAVTVLKGELL